MFVIHVTFSQFLPVEGSIENIAGLICVRAGGANVHDQLPLIYFKHKDQSQTTAISWAVALPHNPVQIKLNHFGWYWMRKKEVVTHVFVRGFI